MAEVNSVLIIPAILIIFILARRVMNNSKGAKYSVRSILMTPIIYLLLTVFFIIGLTLLQDLGLFITIIVGVLVGLVLGKRSDIFEKDGKVLYKRSNEVMALWIIGFVVRIGIDFFYNPALAPLTSGTPTNSTSTSALLAYDSSPVVFGADILLAFSAGLLLGESIVLYRKHRSIYKPDSLAKT